MKYPHITPDLWPLARPIGELKPDPRNARRHPERNLSATVRSLKRYGQRKPVVANVRSGLVVEAGNATLAAALQLGWTHLAVVRVDDDPTTATGYAIADNRTAELAEWDQETLAACLEEQADAGVPLEDVGYTDDELAALLAGGGEPEGSDPGDVADPGAEVPDAARPADSKPGTVYHLGPHRLLCGDSTDPAAVRALCDGAGAAELIHADPPYGMGKERDGIANDNLYREQLDAFQAKWWEAWRPALTDTGSVYIWGQADDLWRFWYGRLVQLAPSLVFRNEVVWDKEHGFGMLSPKHRQFATVTERCLFGMLGRATMPQGTEQYWAGWEPLRAYLDGERERVGWGPSDVRRITGTFMYGHWFSRSQWRLPSAEHYAMLQAAAQGAAFTRPHAELQAEWEPLAEEFAKLRDEWMGTRAWFDNVHDKMSDVWRFPRVQGEERYGHATPKPVELVERAIRSSCPPGGLVLEPFLGTGTTVVAAARAGRVCFGAELDPAYCDTIRRRWTKWAGAAGVDAGPGALA